MVEKVKSQVAAACLLVHGHQIGQESSELADSIHVLIHKLVFQKVAKLSFQKIKMDESNKTTIIPNDRENTY
jgi:hypothetical protein